MLARNFFVDNNPGFELLLFDGIEWFPSQDEAEADDFRFNVEFDIIITSLIVDWMRKKIVDQMNKLNNLEAESEKKGK